ncbi:MFS transporter [Acidithiobacillus sp. AMEEHan]|uniref:MFS transporter n=1 Tax=Acidithiobacillus sp. AMEEHan TaxID=2994951 RepID=UPI0027E49530|nr:MFS transporter [Acidithiobacillus sp. AMEEHan]
MLKARHEGQALVAFYFFYFCALGAFMPYWGPWLRSVGQDAFAIGLLTAAVQFSKVLAPNVWGWLLHHASMRWLIGAGGLAAALNFLLLFWAGGHFLALLLITLLFSFFWAATLPLVDNISMAWAERQGRRYGRIRLWGSIGFIALSLAMGVLVSQWGLRSFLPGIALFLFLTWWASRFLPFDSEPQTIASSTLPAFLPELRDFRLWFFLAAGILEQASHGVYYAFYSIYVEAHGYDSTTVGLLWALAVLAEVLFFWFGDRILQRWGTMTIFVSAFLLTALRWMVIAVWPGFVWIVLVQTLHAASYAAFHLAAIHWVFARFPQALRPRGMALYASLVYGLGGGLGALAAGWAWSHWGGSFTFFVAGVLAAVATLLLLGMFRPHSALEKWV